MPARAKSHTLRRSLELLSALPAAGIGLTPQDLQGQLLALGHKVDERTVQRDLLTLSEQFPALCRDDTSKPHRWRWESAAAKSAVAGMSTPEALSLVLVQQHLQAALPASMLGSFTPLFERAQAQLDRMPLQSGVRTWPAKLRVIPPGLHHAPLKEPSSEVVAAVSEALLQGRQLRLHYQRGAGGRVLVYNVAPLGLLMRGAMRYLVEVVGKGKVRMFALQRIQHAEVMLSPARVPVGESLDSVLARTGGRFGVALYAPPVRLSLLCERPLADVLEEAPLSPDQEIERRVDKLDRVRATLPASWELRWWLLAHVNQVEVESPTELRRWMHKSLSSAAERHR
jgi:predicted DNA-binding transcriptional regulator YafY